MTAMSKKQGKAGLKAMKLRAILERSKIPYLVVDRERFDRRVAEYIAAMKEGGWSDIESEIRWATNLIEIKRRAERQKEQKEEREKERGRRKLRQKFALSTMTVKDREFERLREEGFRSLADRPDLEGAPDEEVLEFRKAMLFELRRLKIWIGTTSPIFDVAFEEVARADLIEAGYTCVLKALEERLREAQIVEARRASKRAADLLIGNMTGKAPAAAVLH